MWFFVVHIDIKTETNFTKKLEDIHCLHNCHLANIQ